MDQAHLFERLAQGHAARISVVTPNRRLAQALVSEFDAFQIRKSLSVWEAPDILPFGAFVERLWEGALYADIASDLPQLLTPAQEQLIWQKAIVQSRWEKELLAIAETAAQCREAWRLLHQWRIGSGPGNEDAAAFSAWCSRYLELTRDEVDVARLPDLASALLKEQSLKKPSTLIAHAFDILPPQTEAFFKACALEEIEVVQSAPQRRESRAVRTSFSSFTNEIEAAASWARGKLEASAAARIGVVVPDLEARRKEVARVFSRVLGGPLAFNVSLGQPLTEYPLAAAALAILEISNGEIPFEKASGLMRGPFLGGAESEMAERARLDAKIRRDAPASLSLPKLLAFAAGCPALRASLENLFSYAKEQLRGEKQASEWAQHFSALLEAAGFPGERTLDSQEFQTRAKWHELLAEFAKLDRAAGRVSSREAFSILRRLCAETPFQPAHLESGVEAPIQVLGILESAGMQFDHLWVSGLTDEAWPLHARPNPFIQVALQKKAGIPQASAEGSLALDRRITEHWLGAADEVVLSFPGKEADRDLAPSPLILPIQESSVPVPRASRYRDLIFAKRELSSIEDTKAPAVRSKAIRGGTRVLADQAACAFRAFARWRLAAAPLQAPSAGLDASDRGKLLHELMSLLWSELKGSAALQTDLEPAIGRAAAAAVKKLKLEGHFAALERERLARLAREWLEQEAARSAFEVVCVERAQTLSVAGLELSGRIDRMDRILEGAGRGDYVLVDYKTGRRPSPKQWDTPRPDDPQLPLYAVSANEEIAAVAFAALRPGAMRFMGFSRDENLISGVKKAKSWPALLQAWRKEAESLGGAFAAGDARVDPKKGLQTCRQCDLQPLCRIHEKLLALADEAEDE